MLLVVGSGSIRRSGSRSKKLLKGFFTTKQEVNDNPQRLWAVRLEELGYGNYNMLGQRDALNPRYGSTVARAR